MRLEKVSQYLILLYIKNMSRFKIFKRTSLLLIALFGTMISGYSCSKKKSELQKKPETVEWVTQERMPILSWHSVNLTESSLKNYRDLADCGYTHSLATIWDNEDPVTKYNANLLEIALNYAEQTNIKVIAGCHELNTDTENTVRRFMDHPALVGWFLKDEPVLSEIPGLGLMANKIQAIDKKNFVYVNLRPSDATPEQMGTSSYTTYLNSYLQNVPVEFLSFDKYPCQIDNNGKLYVFDRWYDNLQIFADAAKQVGKDFWAFASCTKFESVQATPTLETLRLQMYTNLAYGAQGLQYYVYQNPNSPVYAAVKQLNKEIQNYAKVFLKAKVNSVTHTGKVIPYNTTRFDKAPSVIKKFLTGDGGAVVSVMEKGDRKFFVVVSRDLNNVLPVSIEVASSVKKVTKNGTLEEVNGLVNENVTPGDILVYTWK